MGMVHFVYLSSGLVYSCCKCSTHLTDHSRLVSENFHGRHGRAFLFQDLVNVYEGEEAHRTMTTGEHRVRDLYCMGCMRVVGWRYIKAYEKTERYKERKCILEINITRQSRISPTSPTSSTSIASI
ncbi:hypothetical protein H4R34_002261 [Dimargaris verticillata]|uniref:Protein yippee-like n=1 Tax=Dimargaris verticillata TaxID=2761393 RepID=A0A9W8B4H8_9FUNG|nr:hypothetical protein H4R34_002261 [Dimargaris verticillata]